MAVERAGRLGKPIYILENGVPDAQDRIRPWLLVSVTKELHSLIAEGYDIRGYFHWTLTEYIASSGPKAGICASAWSNSIPKLEARTMRGSGRLYCEITRINGLTRELIDRYATEPTSTHVGAGALKP